MEINIKKLKELITNDEELPLVIQSLKIEKCSNKNMIMNKFVPMKNSQLKFNFIIHSFYKPISKSFKNND